MLCGHRALKRLQSGLAVYWRLGWDDRRAAAGGAPSVVADSRTPAAPRVQAVPTWKPIHRILHPVAHPQTRLLAHSYVISRGWTHCCGCGADTPDDDNASHDNSSVRSTLARMTSGSGKRGRNLAEAESKGSATTAVISRVAALSQQTWHARAKGDCGTHCAEKNTEFAAISVRRRRGSAA